MLVVSISLTAVVLKMVMQVGLFGFDTGCCVGDCASQPLVSQRDVHRALRRECWICLRTGVLGDVSGVFVVGFLKNGMTW